MSDVGFYLDRAWTLGEEVERIFGPNPDLLIVFPTGFLYEWVVSIMFHPLNHELSEAKGVVAGGILGL